MDQGSLFVSNFTPLEEAKILLQWLGTMDGLSDFVLDIKVIPTFEESDIIETLQDGISIFEALNQMDNNIFSKGNISYDVDDAYQAYKNFKLIIDGLVNFYEQLQGVEESDPEANNILVFQVLNLLKSKLVVMKSDISQTSIRSINQAAFVNLECLLPILELSLGVAVNCEVTEQIIGAFTDKLDEQTLDDLMQITQDVLHKYGKKDEETDENTFTQNNEITYNDDDMNVGNNTMVASHTSAQKNYARQAAASSTGGFMDMSNKLNEKAPDDDHPLDFTKNYNEGFNGQSPAGNRSMYADNSGNKNNRTGSKSPGGSRRGGRNNMNSSKVDISMDHSYLQNIDAMEEQNKNYRIELDKLQASKEEEAQQALIYQEEMEKLHQRIADLEMTHQKQEQVTSERQRSMEYEIEMKQQQMQILQDQIKDKQAEFTEKLFALQEELEVEKENGYKLERITAQRDQFQKVIMGLQTQMETFQEQKITIQSQTDQLKNMQKEVAVVDELQSVVKLLREDLAIERQKCTDFELQIHDKENLSEDLQRQLTMIKKKEDMLKQSNQELQYEVDKLRESDINNTSMASSSSIQQTMIQELEMKIQSLNNQNSMLKTGNQENINAKYIELENKTMEAERAKNSITLQLEQEKGKNKKLIADFDQMTSMMKDDSSDKKASNDSNLQAMVMKNQKLEAKLRDMEVLQKEIKEMKTQRDKQQVEFKELYDSKQKLYEDIMALKDQIATSRQETKEKIMGISFVEKEKSMLEAQLEEKKDSIKKLEQEKSDLQNSNRQLESKVALLEQQIVNIKEQYQSEKESLQSQLVDSQTHGKTLQKQLQESELKAAQVQLLEKQLSDSQEQLQLSKQHQAQVAETQAKSKDEENVKKQNAQLQIQQEYQNMHYQNDIIKYKMRIKELETNSPGKDKEKELSNKIQLLKDQHEREKENLKSEMQQQIRNTSNTVKALQVELDLERNQMSAHEEMMHSLIHGISLEFSTFSQKNAGKPKKIKKGTADQPSFMEKRAQQVYQQNS